MEIRTLQYFLKLSETLNFRKTSEEVYIAQPALSRQIQQLEEQVGALLFKRDKRHVELTEAGAYFAKEVRRIILEFEQATRQTAQIHRGEAGEIRVGHSSSSMQSVLPQILVETRRLFPNLKMILSELSNREIQQKVLNREIEVGFAPNVNLSATMESKTVYRENFVVILPESHEVSENNFRDLSIFAQEGFILPPLSVSTGYVESIHALCQQHGFLPRVVHESAYSSTVLRLVEAGMGISIEPKSALGVQNVNVKFIELYDVPQKAETKAFWLKERREELKVFLEILR